MPQSGPNTDQQRPAKYIYFYLHTHTHAHVFFLFYFVLFKFTNVYSEDVWFYPLGKSSEESLSAPSAAVPSRSACIIKIAVIYFCGRAKYSLDGRRICVALLQATFNINGYHSAIGLF